MTKSNIETLQTSSLNLIDLKVAELRIDDMGIMLVFHWSNSSAASGICDMDRVLIVSAYVLLLVI